MFKVFKDSKKITINCNKYQLENSALKLCKQQFKEVIIFEERHYKLPRVIKNHKGGITKILQVYLFETWTINIKQKNGKKIRKRGYVRLVTQKKVAVGEIVKDGWIRWFDGLFLTFFTRTRTIEKCQIFRTVSYFFWTKLVEGYPRI